MEQKTIFEQLGGTYSQQGDYMLPNLTLPDTKEYVIGKYGHMRQRYLKNHRPILYTNLLTSCKLSEHLADIEAECSERMDSLVKAMAKQEGVTEALKAADQMAWVRHMNNIRNRAEEIVLNEFIYTVLVNYINQHKKQCSYNTII